MNRTKDTSFLRSGVCEASKEPFPHEVTAGCLATPKCCTDVIKTVEALEKRVAHITTPMSVRIIGCVVNGPGEARETDIGFTGGGNNTHMVYIAGNQHHRLKDQDIVEHMAELIEQKAAAIEERSSAGKAKLDTVASRAEGIESRMGGLEGAASALDGKLDVHQHVGPQEQTGVGDIEAHLERPGRGVETGRNVADHRGKPVPRSGLRHNRPRAGLEKLFLSLERIRENPYPAKVPPSR